MTNEHLHCQMVPCQPTLGSHSDLFFGQVYFFPIRESSNYVILYSEEKFFSVSEKCSLFKSCACCWSHGHWFEVCYLAAVSTADLRTEVERQWKGKNTNQLSIYRNTNKSVFITYIYFPTCLIVFIIRHYIICILYT